MNAITQRLQRSWQLFTRSVVVIREHPKLLVFPIVTSLITVAIAVFFLSPVALLLLAPHWGDANRVRAVAEGFGLVRIQHGNQVQLQIGPVGAAGLPLLYLASMFLATLCSVAFNSEILAALKGNAVSIRHGFAVAFSRWKSVLLWSLLAGVVGLLIRKLEDRFSFLGKVVVGLIGLAWSVASVFAIPILVREPTLTNPFAVLSKSAETIKKTWGEMLSGYLGMKGSNVVVFWGSVLLWGWAGVVTYLLANPWVLLPVGVVWLMGVLVYSYLASVASRVYLCALYLYAEEGVVPGPYDASMMAAGWRQKKL